jgi:hypothetical protein
MPDIEDIISRLEAFSDKPGETLSQRMARTTVEDARSSFAYGLNYFGNC